MKLKFAVHNLILLLLGSTLTMLVGCKNPLGQEQTIDPNFHPGIYLSLSNSTITVSAPTVTSGASISFSLQLKDQNGANFTDAKTVVFSVSGGTSTGTIGSVTAQGDGLYTANFLGSSVGSALTVSATVDGESIISTLPTVTVVAGNYSLSLSTVATSASSVASSSAVTLTLTVKDSFGNQHTSGGLTVVFTNTGGSSTGTISATTDNGDGTYTATFTGVIAGTATTIHAAISGNAVTSAMPTVTVNSGPATQLAIITGPVNSVAGAAIPTMLVRAVDAAGNTATSFTSTISFAIGTNPSGSPLSGTTSVAATAGASSFPGLAINKVGTGYTLVATAAGLTSATSSAFNITAGAPSSIIISSGNSQSGYTSETLTNPFIVLVRDAYNNNVPSVTVNWAIASGGGSLSSASNSTDAGGLSSSTLTLGVSAGANSATATVNGTGLFVTFSATASLRPLTISSVSPTITFLEGGKTLTINGGGFDSSTTVSVGGSSCGSISLISASQLTCINPMHALGVVSIVLTRSSDSATATLANSFTYSSTLFTSADLVSGALSTHGSSNGTGTAARFFAPIDIIESTGILYVSDTRNNLIRKIDIATGAVTDLAGVRGPAGSTNGLGSVAKFSGPTGMAIAGGYLYVSDTDNCTIRRIDLSTTQVTTWAGTVGSCNPSADGSIGAAATFVHPWGLTTDGTYLYVVDSQDASLSVTADLIRKIDFATTTVTTIAGSGSCGGTNGTGTSASFCAPVGIALSGTNLFIGDAYYYKVRQIDISVLPANVTNFVGANNNPGSTDGVGTAALFKRMGDIVSDGTYLYVADTGNNTIRKIEISTKTVTTVAGTAGTSGFLDGTGTAARLYRPAGMALVGTKIYFTDMGNDAIRTFDTTTGAVAAFAGYGGF